MREVSATQAAVLGVLGLFFGIFAPFAITSGLRSFRNIARTRGRLTGEGSAVFGLVAGVIGTVFWVFGTLYWLAAGL
jgi:hypothetical protein